MRQIDPPHGKERIQCNKSSFIHHGCAAKAEIAASKTGGVPETAGMDIIMKKAPN
jgi:hypothetical protein